MSGAIARRQSQGRLALAVLSPALALAVAGCGAGPRASPSEVAAPPPRPHPGDLRVTGVLAAGDVAGDVAGTPGALGTWTLDGAGSDSPWLPWSAREAIPIRSGVPVTIRLADGSPIGWWLADLAAAGDTTGGDARRLGGREMDAPPLGWVRLERLPTGRWVLAARLFRADGRGDGVTYWSLLAAP